MQIFEAFFIKFLPIASISMPLDAFYRVQAYPFDAKGASQWGDSLYPYERNGND